MLGNLASFWSSADCFLKITSFIATIRVSNNIDQDQAPHFIESDNGPNSFAKLLADQLTPTG